MVDRKISGSIRCLSEIEVEKARQSLAGSDALVVPYACKVSGKTEEIVLVSDAAAENLATALGHFGGDVAVKIFASVVSTELCEFDIATLIGGDEKDVLAEIDRLEAGGFLFKQEVDGMNYYGAGNPPLRRFFLQRFATLKTGPGAKKS
ncbi:MAG: hypothetical protein ISR47_07250 [Rhodospirillales bacterium]|nr:hypothetical protein [Rhodospirillales bacterium]